MLRERYKKLLSPPAKKMIQPWTQEWEQLAGEMASIGGMGMISEEDICRDFLNAGSKWAPDFCRTWPVVIRNTPNGAWNLLQATKEFRHAVAQITSTESTSHFAFNASLQGESQGKSQWAGKRKCLCGEIHEFAECGYLEKEARSNSWTSVKSKRDEIRHKTKEDQRFHYALSKVVNTDIL